MSEPSSTVIETITTETTSTAPNSETEQGSTVSEQIISVTFTSHESPTQPEVYKSTTVTTGSSSTETDITSVENVTFVTSDTTSSLESSSTTEGITTETPSSSVFSTSEANEKTSRHNMEFETSEKTDELTNISSFSTESLTTKNQICISPNGFYPNPSNCRTFYQCSKGIPRLSNCTENFHFNPVMKICEDPCVAMCDQNAADCVTSSDFTDKTSDKMSTLAATSSTTDDDTTVYIGSSTLALTTGRSRTDASTTRETDSSPILYFSTPTDQFVSSTVNELTTGDTAETYGSSTKPDVTTVSFITDQVTSEAYTNSDNSSDDYNITEIIKYSATPDDDNLLSTPEITSNVNNFSSTALPFDSTTIPYTSEVPILETSTLSSSRDTDSSVYDQTTTVATHSDKEETADISTSQSFTSLFTTKTSSITEGETYSESDSSNMDRSTSPFSTDKHTDLSSPTSVLTTHSSCENPEDCSTSVLDPSTQVPLSLCHRNDFLPGHKCNEFINCTESVQVQKKCPTGLYFNPTLRVCDWPVSSGCGSITKPLYRPDNSFDCPCKTCLIPSNKNCKFYYLCLGYTAYHLKCSGNLLFDRRLNTCTYAFRSDCPTSDSLESSTSSTTKRSIRTSPTIKSTTSSTSPTRIHTTSSTSKPDDFTCPASNGLFSDPNNCIKFYQCSNGRLYRMSCPASLHFSEATQRCEYPCDAKCDLTLHCGVSTEAPKDPRCPCRNCKRLSPETCTKYIECTNGKYKLHSCPRGQTFDEKRNICDWAHRVDCRHSSLCPRPTGMFPHEDCHKFVHCSNGIPYIKECGYNLEYDPVRQRCEWPSGRCGAPPIAKEFEIFQAKEHREGWNCPKRFGYFVDEHHCGKFYFCSYETPQLKECSEDLMYNPRIQNCDWKKHVRCDSNRLFKPKKCRRYDRNVSCPSDRTPLPHDRCNMYYDCSAGSACTKQCPVGLYFNKESGMCDLPANVNCFYSSGKEYNLKDFTASCMSNDIRKMADPANKECFYHCRHGKVIAGCCRKGHVYDAHRDKCERT